jgi:hypothetical protein
MLLLTDVYPPFTLDESDYPVRFAIQPGRLTRLAVFFRIVLLIPAAVVGFLLSYGIATIALFVTWLIALVTGRLPVSLHLALAAVLRFQVRYFGYGYLLTATYPTAGLFGDAPVTLGFGVEQLPDPWRLPLTGSAKRLLALSSARRQRQRSTRTSSTAQTSTATSTVWTPRVRHSNSSCSATAPEPAVARPVLPPEWQRV